MSSAPTDSSKPPKHAPQQTEHAATAAADDCCCCGETGTRCAADPASDTPATASEAAEAMPAGDAIGQLLTQISTLQADATAARERHLRAVAELDNFRRRALREREEVRRQALASLIEELLPVLDTLEHGLEAARAHAAGEAFLRGMEMVQARLLSVLSANGVQPIEPLGQVFDPNWHEAVAHQPDATHAEGTVSAVQRIGYRLGERLIRAAAVIVSSGAATADDAAAD